MATRTSHPPGGRVGDYHATKGAKKRAIRQEEAKIARETAQNGLTSKHPDLSGNGGYEPRKLDISTIGRPTPQQQQLIAVAVQVSAPTEAAAPAPAPAPAANPFAGMTPLSKKKYEQPLYESKNKKKNKKKKAAASAAASASQARPVVTMRGTTLVVTSTASFGN